MQHILASISQMEERKSWLRFLDQEPEIFAFRFIFYITRIVDAKTKNNLKICRKINQSAYLEVVFKYGFKAVKSWQK